MPLIHLLTKHFATKTGVAYYSQCTIQQHAGILKLTDLYEYQIVLFMYDYCKNQLPPAFNSIFKYNHEIQVDHPTRQSRLMYVKRCHTTFSLKLPIYKFPIIWNHWFEFAHDVPSHNILKSKMKSTYFNSYQDVVKCENVHCTQCNN